MIAFLDGLARLEAEAAETLRDALGLYVPAGFCDEEGVWHHGPHRRRTLVALESLLGRHSLLIEVARAAEAYMDPLPWGEEIATAKRKGDVLRAALAALRAETE